MNGTPAHHNSDPSPEASADSGTQDIPSLTEHQHEIQRGERFAFGANWRSFLASVDEDRISESQRGLCEMLEKEDLAGLRFLDVGCGSGLSSLAAYRLGATVVSFDYDPDSVACTNELRSRYADDLSRWDVHSGSVLDQEYLTRLGKFDIVYSWGVLHHTGQLRQALSNVLLPLDSPGSLFLAIYNDQGLISRRWRSVKRIYCSGWMGRWLVLLHYLPYFFLRSVVVGTIKYRNPWGEFTNYRRSRGMSIVHDWIDWLGGYPFEVASPEEIFRFYRERGLELQNLRTTNRLGCNEFVFRQSQST